MYRQRSEEGDLGAHVQRERGVGDHEQQPRRCDEEQEREQHLLDDGLDSALDWAQELGPRRERRRDAPQCPCEREREARRRVERQMSDLERALARAERREESALEQIKSEVEARRVAEERAIAERKARVEAEEAIKEREKERQAAERELEKVQEKQREGLLPMFESLAGMFQRAAMGSVNMAGDGTRVPGSSGV